MDYNDHRVEVDLLDSYIVTASSKEELYRKLARLKNDEDDFNNRTDREWNEKLRYHFGPIEKIELLESEKVNENLLKIYQPK